MDMKRDYHRNRSKHRRGRPPPAPARSWRQPASPMSQSALIPGQVPWVQGAVQETMKPLSPSRYRSILVPVDGEHFGEHALPLALGIARRAGAEVRLVHVHSSMQSAFQTGLPYYHDGLDALLRQRRKEYLEELSRRLSKISSVAVKPALLEGQDVIETLCAAASNGTDLVVMATHGRGPLGRLFLGSVADQLVQRLSVPLLLARGHQAPADLTGDPFPRHILVPLDGSRLAEQILEPALALGSLTRAEHTLLQVLPFQSDFSLGFAGSVILGPAGDQRRIQARRYFRRLSEKLGDRGPRVRTRIVHDEQSTPKAILDFARTRDVDLIALATRGRGGLARVFRGSVADRVVRGASVPVLLYRPDKTLEGEASA